MSGSSSDRIEIRAAEPADLEAWQPLWAGYQQFYEVAIDPEISRNTWVRFHDPAEPVHAALAWRRDRAIGLVHWIFHRSTWTMGDYCYLQDLFVAPDGRGAGVGRHLIEHVYAEAAKAGSSRVYWLTHETNTQAMQLYDSVAKKSGFVQYRKLF